MYQNKPSLICCRAPDVLKDLAPGSQPPFLIYNDEVKTDTNKIEEFLEETLAPPQWVKWTTVFSVLETHCISNSSLHHRTLTKCFIWLTTGTQNCAVDTKSPTVLEKTSSENSQDISRIPILVWMTVRILKFWKSLLLYIWLHDGKSHHGLTESLQLLSVLEKKFLSTLVKLNMYLETPLPHELDQNPDLTVSSRLFLDGDSLTLADCNLLPKLNIVKVNRIQQS